METPIGFVTVFAVSGSVVLIARHVHKRLVSEFMKKIEVEFAGSSKNFDGKKKVKFAENVIEPSSNNKEYRRRHSNIKPVNAAKVDHHHQYHANRQPHHKLFKMEEDVTLKANLEDTMPLNRQILYKGILEYKTLLKGGKM
ncbi:uncharacterized protein [Rutidosis leptorrhynchoides]|uniref:uncharacterized protein n=1 Tax=Rutidosis leptorrhynchoides TaxID=125765 RepID=UPI003A990042